ncbi:MAG: MarR family winged helix-turn-helix transcriptional regulator [Dehalococcoidia bacterium]
MPPTGVTVDYAGLHAFRLAIRRFLAFSENAAREIGIDPQQHQLLLSIRALGGESGLTIGEAAESLLLRHHSTVELADRAIRNDLVTRNRDEADRRVVRLALSAKGEAVLRELSEHHVRELRAAGPALVSLLASILDSGSEE